MKIRIKGNTVGREKKVRGGVHLRRDKGTKGGAKVKKVLKNREEEKVTYELL